MRTEQAGFTLVEVMISILLTAIAVAGIVGLATVESRSGRLARHSTEASVLAEDKMEVLRTMTATVAAGTSPGTESSLDAQGSAGGVYDRTWTVSGSAAPITYTVTVTWNEDGSNKSVTMRSERN